MFEEIQIVGFTSELSSKVIFMKVVKLELVIGIGCKLSRYSEIAYTRYSYTTPMKF